MRGPRGIGTLVTLAALALASVPASGADARLDYRGRVLPRRVVESLARPALRAPRDSAEVAALLGGIVVRLQDSGYLDARATADVTGPDTDVLEVRVAEGRRYALRSVVLETPSSEDSAWLARPLGIRAGGWASASQFGPAIDRALDQAIDHGYPYAVLGVSGWECDSSGVAVRLSGGLGPKVTVTRVRFEGLNVTRPRLLEKSMGRLSGLPYNHRAAGEARGRLEQLGLFRSVSFEGLESEGDGSRGQLVYRVVEPHYNRFEGVVGAQGEAGAVGKVALDLGNLLGTGRDLGLAWESRGRGAVSFGAHYAEPLFLGAPVRIEGMLDQHVQDSTFVRTRFGARARVALGGQERLEGGVEGERVVQERGPVQEASLQNTEFALEHRALDGVANPRRGARVRVAAGQSFKTERLRPVGERHSRASAAEIDGEWHRPLGRVGGLTLETRAAGRFSSQRVLPIFERYAIGGAATLRGYDEDAFWVDRFALTRMEWRWFLGSSAQRVFLFWDHAWASTRLADAPDVDHLQRLSVDGIGFGLRLEAAGGLVGLDYGLAPGRPPTEGKIHLRLVSTF